MQRTPDTAVIKGLTTKADKIRALARAGYLRTEIAEFLDIGYQHVRRVLTDAGIAAGLQRNVEFERPPVSLQTDLTRKSPTTGEFLLQAGFKLLGEWVATSTGEFELNAKAPRDVGVYAFLVDDIVVYVGLAQSGFRMRMGHYRRGHERQRTSARVKKSISEALSQGKRVKVLIAMPDIALEWKGLPINAAAGLEVGLIRMIQPPWNLLGKLALRRSAMKEASA